MAVGKELAEMLADEGRAVIAVDDERLNGLTGTADFILAAMSARMSESVWVAMSLVIVCAARMRP